MAGQVHGLIASTSALTTVGGIMWYNDTNKVTNAGDTILGAGIANTDSIILHQGQGNYAASLCRAYNGGGYKDWYLPRQDDLFKLYLNQAVIGGFTGNFVGGYWSSTETSISTAFAGNFTAGIAIPNNVKFWQYLVRAVRTF